VGSDEVEGLAGSVWDVHVHAENSLVGHRLSVGEGQRCREGEGGGGQHLCPMTAVLRVT